MAKIFTKTRIQWRLLRTFYSVANLAPPAPNIPQLPPEIWTSILLFCDSNSLPILAQVGKQLNKVCEEYRERHNIEKPSPSIPFSSHVEKFHNWHKHKIKNLPQESPQEASYRKLLARLVSTIGTWAASWGAASFIIGGPLGGAAGLAIGSALGLFAGIVAIIKELSFSSKVFNRYNALALIAYPAACLIDVIDNMGAALIKGARKIATLFSKKIENNLNKIEATSRMTTTVVNKAIASNDRRMNNQKIKAPVENATSANSRNISYNSFATCNSSLYQPAPKSSVKNNSKKYETWFAPGYQRF